MSRWLKGALQKKQSHKKKIENKMQAAGHGPGWGSSGEALSEASGSDARTAAHSGLCSCQPPAVGPCPSSATQRPLQPAPCPLTPSLAHTWPISVPSLLLVLRPQHLPLAHL